MISECVNSANQFTQCILRNVEAHLFEYTTSLALGPDLKFKGPEKRIVPTQVSL